MMLQYKLFKSVYGEVCSVNKIFDEIQILSIPIDPDNTDYQAYLKWVAEGNTPIPAENT